MYISLNRKQQLLEFADKKHRAYEGLNNDVHGKMILPLLNLKCAYVLNLNI